MEKVKIYCPICSKPTIGRVIRKDIEGDSGSLVVYITKINCCGDMTLRTYPPVKTEGKRA